MRARGLGIRIANLQRFHALALCGMLLSSNFQPRSLLCLVLTLCTHVFRAAHLDDRPPATPPPPQLYSRYRPCIRPSIHTRIIWHAYSLGVLSSRVLHLPYPYPCRQVPLPVWRVRGFGGKGTKFLLAGYPGRTLELLSGWTRRGVFKTHNSFDFKSQRIMTCSENAVRGYSIRDKTQN
jgi:hypothetical protein